MLAMRCPVCQAVNNVSREYCGACGGDLWPHPGEALHPVAPHAGKPAASQPTLRAQAVSFLRRLLGREARSEATP